METQATRDLENGGVLEEEDGRRKTWVRVAGVALGTSLLGAALGRRRPRSQRLAVAGGAVLGMAAIELLATARRRSKDPQEQLPVHVRKSITIDRSPDAVYAYWRDLENLPRFMAHLEAVREDAEGSLWRAKGPAGSTVEWRAEITIDKPNETIAWRSLEGASVPNRGVVRFKPGPGGRGTELHVELTYDPPAGVLGAAIAKLFGEEPGQQIAGDLRRLKQVLETGGVVHSDASIHSGMHAARPADDDEPIRVLGQEAQP
ncbi:MAG TPA: SRPBCC family protein [Polyangiaceae bacterium]|nr:SRPBCC family protein [Polyangiaceae bacterium]